MKQITELNVDYKTVILRCDYNVSFKDGKIVSDEKIKASLETINYLISHKAKVVIMSHLGKIKTEEDKKDNSLFPVYLKLSELLKTRVIFSSATSGEILETKIKYLNPKEVLLMENTRFEDLNDERESKCNAYLSKYWASLGDLFINDAFGMTHRRHASNYGISKYLPSGIGFLIMKEIKGLEPVIKPEHPFIVIMGGAKLDDKIAIIKQILPKCDYLLLGGGIANTFLKVNYNVGMSLVSDNYLKEAGELLKKYSNKIMLPEDAIILRDNQTLQNNVMNITNEDNILDIGSMTIVKYQNLIKQAQTIFLNGTVGKYEDERFASGTKKILEAVSVNPNIRVIGGGDALSSAEYFNINDFTFISTGGGATLEYIATNTLKCLEQ